MKKLLFLLFVVVANLSLSDGKKRRVYFREVSPTTSDTIIRSQRGVIATGYRDKVIEQHAAATAALEEASLSAQATQLLVENLQNSIKLRQQLGTQQMAITPGVIRLIDEYGNEMGRSQPQHQSGGGYSYPLPPSRTQAVPQKSSDPVTNPGPQNAYLPPQQQVHTQPQQLFYHPQYLPQAQLLQTHPSIAQPQPLFQQFVTPEGLIFHQVVEQPQPPQQQLVYHPYPPQPQPLAQGPIQYYHHPQTPIALEAQPPQPVIPVEEKVIQPILTKTILPVEEVLPTVKLVKQPILPPAVFQKQIFAVKNPSVRVHTYSDLCTVYPYQRKLSACVYKKAAIPELHHPDIQLVPEETPTQQSQSGYGEGQLNPRTQPLRLNSQKSETTTSSSGAGAGSIQDILNREKIAQPTSSESSEEEHDRERDDDEIGIVDEENSNVAESSNKKEKLVIKTTKPDKPSAPTTLNPKSRTISVPSMVQVPPTIRTSTNPPTTTSKRPKKDKQRSRNNKRRRANKKSNSSSTTTTNQPFKLA